MALFDCFKKRIPSDSPDINGCYPQDSEYKKPAKKDNYERIAIIIGHTKSSKGASLYPVDNVKTREYDWNNLRAKEIKEIIDYQYPHKKVKIFYRDGIGRLGVAKQAGKWNASISLELHFNSIGHEKNAYGSEMLVMEGDDKSALVSADLVDVIVDEFKTKKRHRYTLKNKRDLRGIKTLKKKDRGYHNLKYLKDNGVQNVMLVEPFFGGTKTHESEPFVNDPLKYSTVLANFLGNLS